MPKRKLDKKYNFRGRYYGPGDSVEVPEDWPEGAGEEVKRGRPKASQKSEKEESEEE